MTPTTDAPHRPAIAHAATADCGRWVMSGADCLDMRLEGNEQVLSTLIT